MQIKKHVDIKEFLATAEPILLENEAENSLILGLAYKIQMVDGKLPEGALLYSFSEVDIHQHENHFHSHAKKPFLFAIRTSSAHAWVVAPGAAIPEGALFSVAHCLRGMHPETTSVLGFAELAESIFTYWGLTPKRKFDQLLYRCDKVIMPEKMPSGLMRRATESDLEVLIPMHIDFMQESMHDVLAEDQAKNKVANFIAAGDLWVWENGQIVSMAIVTRRSPHSASIGYVFTPKHLRKQGYASALVAQLTEHCLKYEGNSFAVLYTDASVPTSNRIYQDIGYQVIKECAMIFG